MSQILPCLHDEALSKKSGKFKSKTIITRSELASLAHSLYACIKHHINDCALVTIDTSLGSTIVIELFISYYIHVGHVAAKCGAPAQA